MTSLRVVVLGWMLFPGQSAVGGRGPVKNIKQLPDQTFFYRNFNYLQSNEWSSDVWWSGNCLLLPTTFFGRAGKALRSGYRKAIKEGRGMRLIPLPRLVFWDRESHVEDNRGVTVAPGSGVGYLRQKLEKTYTYLKTGVGNRKTARRPG